jgi:[protein-PII] uridylyltransferase
MPPLPDREVVLNDSSLRGAALCRALSDEMDRWMAGLFAAAAPAGARLALVAVGGYGRRELSPQSDIDVVLLSTPRADVASTAEKLWYPVWDAGLKLGHAVRTVGEALSLADDDLDTATSLLSVRHLAGDESLTHDLARRSDALWQRRSRRWLLELNRSVKVRHARAGDAAFLLEPNLKDGRGGLRDVHAIHWAEEARPVMLAGDDTVLPDAYGILLDARVELHRRTGRPGDVLHLQEQDAVADALGYDTADALMAALAGAARSIAWRSDEVWERVEAALEGPVARRFRRDRQLAPGVMLRNGRAHLTDGPNVGGTEPDDGLADPLLLLRVAVAAAEHGVRVDRASLERLRSVPPLPEPWPAEPRDLFARLWLAGAPAIDVVESLDQVGLWQQVLPEWAHVRSRPQRNAYHTFTVDRHLCETAVNAAALADRVDRPDLLVTGALLHDIGKGLPGDHTEVGIELVGVIAARMGHAPDDSAVLADMVRHHLLLPDVATRRDLSDDDTITWVAEAVGDLPMLHLLGALTEADSQATGPAAWNDWKRDLVRQLVRRTAHKLAGGDPIGSGASDSGEGFPTPAQQELVEAGETVIDVDGDVLTVVAPDRSGLFGRVASVLALAGMDVLAADAWSSGGMALEVFTVSPPVNPERAWAAVLRDLEPAIAGQLALTARLADRARSHQQWARQLPGIATPAVRVDNDMSRSATVLEVVADDAVGLLANVARTIAELGLDIRSAKVQTLGSQVVDTFYVVDGAGGKVTDEAYLAEVCRELGHVIGIGTAT